MIDEMGSNEMLGTVKTHLGCVVVQPTSLCNLNCSYCYLPERNRRQEMAVATAHRIAAGIEGLGVPVRLIWHGGEPLACGADHLHRLMRCFSGCSDLVNHYIQTNGTLIDDRWCDLFSNHRVSVGVSLDGPVWLSKRRLDWRGRESFEKVLKGIEILRDREIAFSAIAVVGEEALDHPQAVYEFFRDLGCFSLGINIEELEGENRTRMVDDHRVSRFWASLFEQWKRDPTLKIREFAQLLPWLARYGDLDEEVTPWASSIDIFPSIAHNGDVVLLSPEFLSVERTAGETFVVGNVRVNSLEEILSSGRESEYVSEFARGLEACKSSCEYFDFCGGGQASNKFFETGRLDATETVYCRNGRIRLIDAILAYA